MRNIKIAVTMIILVLVFSGCDLLGGLFKSLSLKTQVGIPEAKSISRSYTASPDIASFSIGSSDIMAWTYDFEGLYFDTPMYRGDGDNFDEAALLGTSITFTEGNVENYNFDSSNLPNVIDILVFQNSMFRVKYNGSWYGNNNRDLEDEDFKYCDNYYLLGEEEFELVGMTLYFINKDLLDEEIAILDAQMPSGLTASEEALLTHINDYVSPFLNIVPQPSIFIPMDQIVVADTSDVLIYLNLDNAFASLTYDAAVNSESNPGKLVLNVNEYSSPLDYYIQLASD